MVIFLTLNHPIKLIFPILDDFTNFQTASHVYIQICLYYNISKCFCLLIEPESILCRLVIFHVSKTVGHVIFLDRAGDKCPQKSRSS